MGFLSLYEKVERVNVLGDEWWVDIRCHLTSAESDRAQRALVSPKMQTRITGKQQGQQDAQEVTTTIDQAGYHHELLVAAIVGWNLTDKDDVLLPLAPDPARRNSIKQLPDTARNKIVAAILANRDRSKADDDAFRGDGESGDAAPELGVPAAGAGPLPA